MKEINVSAESEEKKTDVRISVNKITPKEIKQIPTVGGEPDLAQYLQVLPGVIFPAIRADNCISGEVHLSKIKC